MDTIEYRLDNELNSDKLTNIVTEEASSTSEVLGCSLQSKLGVAHSSQSSSSSNDVSRRHVGGLLTTIVDYSLSNFCSTQAKEISVVINQIQKKFRFWMNLL